MAELRVEGAELVVAMSELEKVGAFRGDIRVPLTSVRVVRVAENPRPELRGMRAPGTGIPGVIALGSRRGEGHDFAAVYRDRPPWWSSWRGRRSTASSSPSRIRRPSPRRSGLPLRSSR